MLKLNFLEMSGCTLTSEFFTRSQDFLGAACGCCHIALICLKNHNSPLLRVYDLKPP